MVATFVACGEMDWMKRGRIGATVLVAICSPPETSTSTMSPGECARGEKSGIIDFMNDPAWPDWIDSSLTNLMTIPAAARRKTAVARNVTR
jgi:hypothetical protein